MDYFKLTEVFRDLALQAGDAIMEIYLQLQQLVSLWTKKLDNVFSMNQLN